MLGQLQVVGFLSLYLFAMALFLIGAFGLFGQERDPLSGVFLIPLEIPWIYLLDHLSVPDGSRIWIGILSPVIKLTCICAFCSWMRGSSSFLLKLLCLSPSRGAGLLWVKLRSLAAMLQALVDCCTPEAEVVGAMA